MPRKHNRGTLDSWNRAPLIVRDIPDDVHYRGMFTPYISLCVDLYSWVGEEEGYDGCVAFQSCLMQRGIAIL